MSAYRRRMTYDHPRADSACTPDQLRAQRLVTGMGELYLLHNLRLHFLFLCDTVACMFVGHVTF